MIFRHGDAQRQPPTRATDPQLSEATAATARGGSRSLEAAELL